MFPLPFGNQIREKALPAVKKLYQSGFFSIFITNIIIKAVGLIGNILLVRVMSKEAYGTYTYIINASSILGLVADLGMGMTAIQLCSEAHNNAEKQDAIFSMAFRWSMLITLVSCFLVLFSSWFYPYKTQEIAACTTTLFLLPLITNVNRFVLNNAQIKLENNVYAKINLFSSVIHHIVLLPMAYFFSFRGAIYSDYIIQSCIMIYGIHKSRSFLKLRAPETSIDKQTKQSFIKLSLASALNNTMNVSISLFDVFLMGLIVSNVEMVASYKVAVTIPSALTFIPSVVNVYIMPLFARNRQSNAWVKKAFRTVLLAMSGFNALLCVGAVLFGPQMIRLLYGAEYQDTSLCFAILMIGYFFAAIRIVAFTVLYTQRKVHVNTVLTVVTFALNMLLNFCLIPRYYSVGASLASMLTNAVTAVIMVVCVLYYLHRSQKMEINYDDD